METIDASGRRLGFDRRLSFLTILAPDRRSGCDRRRGVDRRSGTERRSPSGFRMMTGMDRRRKLAHVDI